MSEQSFVLDPSMIAPIKKRVIAGLIDYVVPLLFIFSGVVMISTAFGTFSVVAGCFIIILGIFMVIINQLGGKQSYTGMTNGKRFAKIRMMELVDADKMIIRSIPKGEKGKNIARIIIAVIGTGFFLIYALISLLMINTSKLKRSLADQLTGTVVINFDWQTPPPAKTPDGISSSQNAATFRPSEMPVSQLIAPSRSLQSKESNIQLGRGLVTGGLIGLLLNRIYYFLRTIYYVTDESLSAFAGYSIYNAKLLQTFRILFYVITIVSLLCLLLGLFISMSSVDLTLKTPFLLTLAIFGLYFILILINLFAKINSGYLTLSSLYGYYYTYWYAESVFNLVMEAIIFIVLVIGLTFLAWIFRKAEPVYNSPRQRFIGSTIFLILYVLIKITAVIICSQVIYPLVYGEVVVTAIMYFAFRALYLVMNLILIGVYGAMNRKFRRFSIAVQQSSNQ